MKLFFNKSSEQKINKSFDVKINLNGQLIKDKASSEIVIGSDGSIFYTYSLPLLNIVMIDSSDSIDRRSALYDSIEGDDRPQIVSIEDDLWWSTNGTKWYPNSEYSSLTNFMLVSQLQSGKTLVTTGKELWTYLFNREYRGYLKEVHKFKFI
jgi:hypothetical protein